VSLLPSSGGERREGPAGRGGVSRVRGRWTASDRCTLALLAVVVTVFSAGRVFGSAPAGPWALHALLLASFGLLTSAIVRYHGAAWAPWARAIGTVTVMMILYSSLGRPVLSMIPWRADAWIEAADRFLFASRSPAHWAARHVGDRGIEFWSAIYGFFVPFLSLSIFLGCVGRPGRERSRFLAGFAVTYALAYLGYLFLPTTGPVEFLGTTPPRGGAVHRMIVDSVASTGGNHGAFPSLHVGASSYLCLFDLRHDRLRGLTYAPMVVLIAFSTLFLQYHYVVDLLAGVAIALVADRVAAEQRVPAEGESA
jgi:hypothetical protein